MATKKKTTKKKVSKSTAKKSAGRSGKEDTATTSKRGLEPSQVQEGQLMAFIYWGEVTEVEDKDGDYKLRVHDIDRDSPFTVNGNALIAAAMSADVYATEITATQSEVIQVLMRLYNTPFTVCFDKQDGTERVIRGRLIEPDGLRGRSKVEELLDANGKVVPAARRFKQVDHRTIKWLIANGVKYKVR